MPEPAQDDTSSEPEKVEEKKEEIKKEEEEDLADVAEDIPEPPAKTLDEVLAE